MPITNVDTVCSDPDARGVCDAGDRCVEGKCETVNESYKTSLCRDAPLCCDAPEYCAMYNFDCPADEVQPQGEVCRESCLGECASDPQEQCDGISKTCPANVVVDDTLCIYAGQNAAAGSVSITGTLNDSTLNLCFDMTLDTTNYPLVGSEPIKAYFSRETAPASNPGSYTKFDPAHLVDNGDGTGSYSFGCFSIETCQADVAPLYFAIHLDVSGETAWALQCADTTAFQGLPFMSKGNGKKGPSRQGWGEWFAYTPCCYDEDSCGAGYGACGGDPVDPPSPPPATCTGTCEVSCQEGSFVLNGDACPSGGRRGLSSIFA